MAKVAFSIVKDALETAETADKLAARMEPYLHKRYTESSLYSYKNEHAVPPGDVLLAIAASTGISLDQRLDIVHKSNAMERQIEGLRAEMADLRGQVARFTALAGQAVDPAAGLSDEALNAELDARRRRRARSSPASQPPTKPPRPSAQSSRRRST